MVPVPLQASFEIRTWERIFFRKVYIKEIFGGKPYQRQESLEGRSIYEQECILVDEYRPLQWPSLPWGGGGVCLWVCGVCASGSGGGGGQTNTCENITLPQTSFVGGN